MRNRLKIHFELNYMFKTILKNMHMNCYLLLTIDAKLTYCCALHDHADSINENKWTHCALLLSIQGGPRLSVKYES